MITSQRVHPWENTMLPPKVIQGQSVRDYAYQWIEGGCLIHQWCSGGRGIDCEVIAFVKEMIVSVNNNVKMDTKIWKEKDVQGLTELLQYLIHNEGVESEIYVPDQWANSKEMK